MIRFQINGFETDFDEMKNDDDENDDYIWGAFNVHVDKKLRIFDPSPHPLPM